MGFREFRPSPSSCFCLAPVLSLPCACDWCLMLLLAWLVSDWLSGSPSDSPEARLGWVVLWLSIFQQEAWRLESLRRGEIAESMDSQQSIGLSGEFFGILRTRVQGGLNESGPHPEISLSLFEGLTLHTTSSRPLPDFSTLKYLHRLLEPFAQPLDLGAHVSQVLIAEMFREQISLRIPGLMVLKPTSASPGNRSWTSPSLAPAPRAAAAAGGMEISIVFASISWILEESRKSLLALEPLLAMDQCGNEALHPESVEELLEASDQLPLDLLLAPDHPNRPSARDPSRPDAAVPADSQALSLNTGVLTAFRTATAKLQDGRIRGGVLNLSLGTLGSRLDGFRRWEALSSSIKHQIRLLQHEEYSLFSRASREHCMAVLEKECGRPAEELSSPRVPCGVTIASVIRTADVWETSISERIVRAVVQRLLTGELLGLDVFEVAEWFQAGVELGIIQAPSLSQGVSAVAVDRPETVASPDHWVWDVAQLFCGLQLLSLQPDSGLLRSLVPGSDTEEDLVWDLQQQSFCDLFRVSERLWSFGFGLQPHLIIVISKQQPFGVLAAPSQRKYPTSRLARNVLSHQVRLEQWRAELLPLLKQALPVDVLQEVHLTEGGLREALGKNASPVSSSTRSRLKALFNLLTLEAGDFRR